MFKFKFTNLLTKQLISKSILTSRLSMGFHSKLLTGASSLYKTIPLGSIALNK